MRRSTTSGVYCTETLTCPALACIGLGLDGGEDAMQNLAGRGRARELGPATGGVLPAARVEGDGQTEQTGRQTDRQADRQASPGLSALLCSAFLCSVPISSRNQILSSRRLGLAASAAYQLARHRPVTTPSLSQKSPVGCHAGSMA